MSSSPRLSPVMKRDLTAAYRDKVNHLFTGKDVTRNALMERGLLQHAQLHKKLTSTHTHGYVLTEKGVAEAAKLVGESVPEPVEVEGVMYERRTGGNGQPYEIYEVTPVAVLKEIEEAQRQGITVSVDVHSTIVLHGERPVRFLPKPQETGVTPQELDAEVGEGAAAVLYDAVYEKYREGSVRGDEGLVSGLANRGLVEFVEGHFGKGLRAVITESGRGVAKAESQRRYEAYVESTREASEAEQAIEDRDRAAGVISDEQLDVWAADTVNKGRCNSVAALRPVAPEVRPLVMQEARTFMNTRPGWTLSGAVWEAAKNVQAGQTPGLDANATLMAYDPDGTKAAAQAGRGGSWQGFVAAAEGEAVAQRVEVPEGGRDAFDGIERDAEGEAQAVEEIEAQRAVEGVSAPESAGEGDSEDLEATNLWQVLSARREPLTVVYGETAEEAREAGRRDLRVVASSRTLGSVSMHRLRKAEVRETAGRMLPGGGWLRVQVMDANGVSDEVVEREQALATVVVYLRAGARLHSLTPLRLEREGTNVMVEAASAPEGA